jgi:signal transduction histidine kinase
VGETVSNWPKLLSLAVHELRTPVTVVAGYLRMLLRDRAGPLADTQRRLLEEAEKSCGRLSTLLAEMSELGQLHDGRQALAPGSVDLRTVLEELESAVTTGEGEARVVVEPGDDPLWAAGDAGRLRRTIQSVVFALRREIIDGSDLLVATSTRAKNGGRVAWIAVGARPIIDALKTASPDSLGPFDEWRGGCGLALPLARRVVEMHGGRLMALPGERQKGGGVLELPLT